MKPKRCKTCKEQYTPRSPLQTACSPLCAQQQAKLKREKAEAKAKREEKRQDREKLKELEPIGKLEKRAETAVNAYVRARDARLGYGCISCDKPANWDGQWHASHFRSVGAASGVRYNLWNINRACWICNKLYSGRIDAYTPALIERIGQDKVDWLKAQNKPVRYSREYLERLRAIFAKKTRRTLARSG